MKAPGEDGIFYILIKKLPEATLSSLVKIFNKCFDLAYFPSSWKNAKVIPILKPDKNPAEASSYRPISLLSSISKLFERIIVNRMMTHINENSIFADEQFGFRLGHSTTHCRDRGLSFIIKTQIFCNSQTTRLIPQKLTTKLI